MNTTAIQLLAARMNHQGVSMLVNGEYSKAFEFLNLALSIIDMIIEGPEGRFLVEGDRIISIDDLVVSDSTKDARSLDTTYKQNNSGQSQGFVSCYDEDKMQTEQELVFGEYESSDLFTHCAWTQVAISNLTHDQFCVYNRAIIFHPHASDVSLVEAYKDFVFYSAVVLFNLALCHHAKGISLGISRSLIEASHMYDRTYHLIDECLSLSGGSHLLVAICLNNHALICYELVDRKFEDLLKTMARYLQKHRKLLQGTDIQFWKNLILCPKTFYAAPSA